jgi:hypothetical protein
MPLEQSESWQILILSEVEGSPLIHNQLIKNYKLKIKYEISNLPGGLSGARRADRFLNPNI